MTEEKLIETKSQFCPDCGGNIWIQNPEPYVIKYAYRVVRRKKTYTWFFKCQKCGYKIDSIAKFLDGSTSKKRKTKLIQKGLNKLK